MAELVDINRVRSAAKGGKRSSDVLALMSNMSQFLDRATLLKMELKGRRDEQMMRMKARKGEITVRQEFDAEQGDKDRASREKISGVRTGIAEAKVEKQEAITAGSRTLFSTRSDLIQQANATDDVAAYTDFVAQIRGVEAEIASLTGKPTSNFEFDSREVLDLRDRSSLAQINKKIAALAEGGGDPRELAKLYEAKMPFLTSITGDPKAAQSAATMVDFYEGRAKAAEGLEPDLPISSADKLRLEAQGAKVGPTPEAFQALQEGQADTLFQVQGGRGDRFLDAITPAFFPEFLQQAIELKPEFSQTLSTAFGIDEIGSRQVKEAVRLVENEPRFSIEGLSEEDEMIRMGEAMDQARKTIPRPVRDDLISPVPIEAVGATLAARKKGSDEAPFTKLDVFYAAQLLWNDPEIALRPENASQKRESLIRMFIDQYGWPQKTAEDFWEEIKAEIK